MRKTILPCLFVLAACGSGDAALTNISLPASGADFSGRAFPDTSVNAGINAGYALPRDGISGVAASGDGLSAEVTLVEIDGELFLHVDGVERPFAVETNDRLRFSFFSGAAHQIRRVSDATDSSWSSGLLAGVVGVETPPDSLGGQAHYSGNLHLTSLAGGQHAFVVEMDVDFADGTVDGELTSRYGETTALVDDWESTITGVVDQGRLSARVAYSDGAEYLAGRGDPVFSFEGEMVAATYGPEGYFIGGAVYGQVSGTEQVASEGLGNFWATSPP